MTNSDIVRATFTAYLDQDRDAADRLLADDFVFTSPQDNHIDKATWFDRCFPTVDRLASYEVLHVVPTGGDDVFVLYEYELSGGGRFRNTEVHTVRDGRVHEVQVFFGGRIDTR
ncbi:MAG TPA: nuclear transport factor 2 family protein [Euzebyales bacterium]